MKRTLCEAFDRWKCALIEQDLQTTQAARHRAHARVTSMEDLIAEHPRRTSRASASSWRCTSILAASIPRRQTVLSNKSCQHTRIAFAFSVVTP